MKTRWIALLTVLFLLVFSIAAQAELPWKTQLTAGQQALKEYTERVNDNLYEQGLQPINSLFELYSSGASMGITDSDQAELPQGVELTFTLNPDSLDTLVLRVSDPSRFPAIAAACLQAASPETMTLKQALKDPALYAKKATDSPSASFQDEVIQLNGTMVHAYYAYYPNQYSDNVNWLQLTIVFPLPGYENSGVYVTDRPAATPEVENEGYFAKDDAVHVEVFTTETPEPDSAAGGWLVPDN